MKKVSILVVLLPPLQGEGRGGVACKNGKSRFATVICHDVPGFYREETNG